MSHQYNYEIGKSAILTGTAAINGTVNVVGTGTLALTELASGDLVILNGETRIVDAISDDLHWSVTSTFISTASGLSITGIAMKNLEDELGLSALQAPSAPNSNEGFMAYTQPLDLADGTVRGGGWIATEWKFNIITQAMREALRPYCPETGASATVWIRTRVYEGDAYRYYRAVMVWPIPEKREAGRRHDFSIKFRAMVEIT